MYRKPLMLGVAEKGVDALGAHAMRREHRPVGGCRLQNCDLPVSSRSCGAPPSCFSIRPCRFNRKLDCCCQPGRVLFGRNNLPRESTSRDPFLIVNCTGSQSLWTRWIAHLPSGKGVYARSCLLVCRGWFGQGFLAMSAGQSRKSTPK